MNAEILSISIGGIVSIVVERVPVFQRLTSRQKLAVIFVVCLGVVQILFALKEAFIGRLPIGAEEFIRSVEMGLIAIFSSQLTHMLERRLW